MSDEQRGIYRKYEIKRTDGSSAPGGRHERCAYYVLDLEHDEFALVALKAYAKACRKTHPDLAADIERIISTTFTPQTPSEMATSLMSDPTRKL